MEWDKLGMGTRMGLQCQGWAEETAGDSRVGLQGPRSAVHEQGQPWAHMVSSDALGPARNCVGVSVGTHACSCAAWHPHSSQAGTRRSGVPPCCRGSAGSDPCAGRMPLGPSCRCYHGIGRAGSVRRAAAGPRSIQAHTRHSGDLPAQSTGQHPGTGDPQGHRACCDEHPPVYPGLHWQTTCWEWLSW